MAGCGKTIPTTLPPFAKGPPISYPLFAKGGLRGISPVGAIPKSPLVPLFQRGRPLLPVAGDENSLPGVIWDMDGVIVDSAQLHFRSWRAAFRSYNVGYTWEDFIQRFGRKNEAVIKHVLGDQVTSEIIDAIATAKEDHFRDSITRGEIETFPGAVELIKSLSHAGFPLALASSAPRQNVDLILRKLRLRPCFQVIVSAEDVTEGKPAPQVFLVAAERLRTAPERCLVFEDAVAGVEAAKNAGMKCIAVTNTTTASRLQAADLVVDSLKKVSIQTVQRLFDPARVHRGKEVARMIKVKRIYGHAEPGDGKRFLVDRLWPRGTKKESLKLDGWLKEVAPSDELRRWFAHDPQKWQEFQERYFDELDARPEAWHPLVEAARVGDITLLYGASDTEHNNAVALKAYLEKGLK